MLKRTLMIAGLMAGLVAAAPAMAAPMAPLANADVPEAQSLVVPVHGCHRDTQLGPLGWHFHGRGCQRIASGGPRRYAPPPRYYDPYPRPRPRPACFQECNYIGPIRQSRTVCR